MFLVVFESMFWPVRWNDIFLSPIVEDDIVVFIVFSFSIFVEMMSSLSSKVCVNLIVCDASVVLRER